MANIKIVIEKLLIISFALLLSYSCCSKEKVRLIFAGEMTEIDSDKKGGYSELATLLKQYRQLDTPTFFLFGGGSLGPSTLSSLDRGTHIIDLLNSLEPDAMGVAKREFSFLEDELSLRSYEAAFPLVASNLKDSFTNENLDGLVDSAIVQQGQYKLGVLSILDESVIEQYALSRIDIIDQRSAIKKRSKELLEQGVDLIILLYSNFTPDINQLLKENIVDISLMRDEHLPLDNFPNVPQHHHDIIINENRKVAVLELLWTKGNRQSLKVNWSVKNLDNYSKDHDVLKQVRNYTKRLAMLLDQPIGTLVTPMDTRLKEVRTRENSFGNYIADTMKSYTDADIAVINGGTIRGDKLYEANSRMSRSDIIKELPFRNKIALLNVTGKQIIAALENGLSLLERAKGRFLQVSGIQVMYDSSRDVGNRVISVTINNEAIIPEQKYRLATTSYISVGGDGFVMFKKLNAIKYTNQTDRLLSDVIIDTIKSNQKLSIHEESRLIDLNDKKDFVNK